MNANYKRLRTKFGPETRFEVRPGPPAPFGARLEPEFERLKLELPELPVRALSAYAMVGLQ